ncbi:MAG: SsrA-binding protein [Planctomycetes bacterium]|nr:SsrA-binding protein [Planctomycetota bacterium]
MKAPDGNVVVARNRRARHDYEVEETVEAGIVLAGTEVKGLRAGRAAIDQAYARIVNGEVWLIDANIPEYAAASFMNHRPQARRKLLLHRRQIQKIETRLQGSGRTLIPLQIHFTERGIAKVVIAIARGRRRQDKRSEAAKREAGREIQRSLGDR